MRPDAELIAAYQEKVETEIKEREEAMRAILSQQEAVEKEIIEAKQTQRHLVEIVKREQKGKVKISRDLQSFDGEEDPPTSSLSEND